MAAGAEPGRWSPYAARWSGNPAELAAVRDGTAGVQDEGSQLAASALARIPSTRDDGLVARPVRGAGRQVRPARRTGPRAVGPTARRRARAAPGALGRPGAARLSPAADGAGGRRHSTRPGTPGPSTGCWPTCRAPGSVPCGAGRSRAGGGRRPTSRTCTRCRWPCSTSAVAATAPGGVVAYVTCSPHRHETEHVVGEVLAQRAEIEIVPAAGAARAPAGRLRRAVPAAVAASARHRRDVRRLPAARPLSADLWQACTPSTK